MHLVLCECVCGVVALLCVCAGSGGGAKVQGEGRGEDEDGPKDGDGQEHPEEDTIQDLSHKLPVLDHLEGHRKDPVGEDESEFHWEETSFI